MSEIIDWLLDTDPAIRWQVLRDLNGADPNDIASERARVSVEGWGKRLLDLQGADGKWGGGVYSPKWISTTYTLLLVRHLGIDPSAPAMRTATDRVREKVAWREWNRPFFDYVTETCVTGMILAVGSYFLEDPSGMPQPEPLLDRQRDDGGWNCRVNSDRSSFHTTITVLEALLEYEHATGGDRALKAARERAHDYLLDRRLMYSLSTGELINPRWLLMSFPPRWHYDVLRALDYLREAEVTPDDRWNDAVEVILSKRRSDGRWPLQNRHAGREHFQMEEGAGKPSHWNTLRALRVLQWHDASGYSTTLGNRAALR